MEQKPGNKAFWEKVRSVGRPLSYISEPEASKQGGKSDISESEAAKVRFVSDRNALTLLTPRPWHSSYRSKG